MECKVVTEASPSPNNSLSRIETSPWLMFWLLAALFTVRWVWVAGITGDYGWAYETAARVLRGEIPYRDYISSLPPLMPYTLAPFIALFKGNLWAWQIHLYLWWLASLVVSLRLLQRLATAPRLQTSAVLATACLSYPASWTGVPHNYASATFFGATLLAVLAFRKSPKPGSAIVAGVWVTLATLAKQNVGAAAFVAAAIGLIEALWAAGRLRSVFKTLAWFALGASGTFLPFLIYFGTHAGFRETLTQFAIDGGGGKGVLKMLFNLLPIFYFDRGVPHRHLLDVIVTLVVDSLLLVWFALKILRPNSRAETTSVPSRFWIPIGLILLVAFSLITLINLPGLKSELERTSFYFSYGKVVFFFYAAVLTFGPIVLIQAYRVRASFNFVVCSWLLLLVCSFALSLLQSSIYAAPIAIPLFFWLLREYGLITTGVRFAVCGSVIAAAFISVLPTLTFTPSFERLYALPVNSNFAGLYGTANYAWKIEQLTKNVSSRIRNHTTLWLVMGGPHLAFGGRPVKAVPLIHEDTYGLRAEAPLMEEWQRNPPDFIMHQETMPIRAGSRLFTNEYVSHWLASHYRLVWDEPRLDLSLWENTKSK